MSIINPAELDLKEEAVVRINRVAKVTSRGKRFSFSTLVVIGDGRAHVGIGAGKANEVLVSITKAKENARQNIVKARNYIAIKKLPRKIAPTILIIVDAVSCISNFSRNFLFPIII